MTDIITDARAYLSTHAAPCGNDACVGDQAREVIEGLCAEVERLEQVCSGEADDVLYFKEQIAILRETQQSAIDSALNIKDGILQRSHDLAAEVARLEAENAALRKADA